MSSAFLLCHGPIAGAVGLGKGRVLVSVQSDGVACFDTSSQVRGYACDGAACDRAVRGLGGWRRQPPPPLVA